MVCNVIGNGAVYVQSVNNENTAVNGPVASSSISSHVSKMDPRNYGV